MTDKESAFICTYKIRRCDTDLAVPAKHLALVRTGLVGCKPVNCRGTSTTTGSQRIQCLL